MPANRFTNLRPTQFDYQSTAIPLPFNEIAAVGETKQKQYESNLVDTQNLLNGIKVKSRPEDQPALKEKIDYYNSKVQNISNKVAGDVGNPEYRRELNQLAGEIKTDLVAGDLAAIQHNANTYNDWLTKVQSSKNYKPFLDRSFYDVAPGQYKGFKNSETGQYNLTSVTGIDESLERDKKADELVKGIASNKSGGFKWSKDPNTGDDIIVDYKGETVSPEKIKATFEPLFKNSEEYKQLEREAEYASKTAGVKKQDYINHHMNELLYGVTSKYSKKDFDQNLNINRLPEHQSNQKPTIPVYEIPEQQKVKNPSSIDFNSAKGSTTRPTTGFGMGENAARAGENIMGIPQPTADSSSKPYYENLKKEQKPIFDKVAKTMFPEAKEEDLKSNQTFDAVQNYMEKIGTLVTATPINTSIYEGTKGETLQKADQEKIKRNYDTRVFYDLDENKPLEGTSDEIKKLIGNEKTKVEVVGEYDPKNYFSMLSGKPALEGSPLRVRITDEDGNAKIYAVSKPFTKQSPTDKDVSKVFTETSTLPGVPKEFDIKGNKINITYNPQSQEYIVEGMEKPVKNLENFINYIHSKSE
mgnify:CR=1 FL=1